MMVKVVIVKKLSFVVAEQKQNKAEADRDEAGSESSSTITKNAKPVTNGESSGSASANDGGDIDATSGESKNKKSTSPNGDVPGSDENNSGSGNGNNLTTGQINQSIQIGRPRFLLSGGLVFSPLRRVRSIVTALNVGLSFFKSHRPPRKNSAGEVEDEEMFI